MLILAFGPASWALGQSSSLFGRTKARKAAALAATTRPANGVLPDSAGSATSTQRGRNTALAGVSLTAVRFPEPKVIKIHDLVGVIIRYRLKHQSTSKVEQESEWNVNAKLEAWFRLHDRKWTNQGFRAGLPEIKFKNENELDNEGKSRRKDILETRLMAKVIDVKPNGNLIIIGWSKMKVGEELQYLRLTGECNPDHFTPDGNIMSDKIFAIEVDTLNEGAVQDAVKRGWFKGFMDKVKPF